MGTESRGQVEHWTIDDSACRNSDSPKYYLAMPELGNPCVERSNRNRQGRKTKEPIDKALRECSVLDNRNGGQPERSELS